MHNEPRYLANDRYEGFLLVEPDSYCVSPDFYSVELSELSRSGIQLRSQRPIPSGKSFSLTFITGTGSLEIAVAGDIRWTREDEVGTLIGCSLAMPLPDSVFDEVTATAMTTTQRLYRYRNTIDINGYLELGRHHFAAALKNYSPGGFCVETDQMFTPASQLRYVLTDPQRVTIVSNVEWRMPSAPGRYLLGCSFVNNEDARRLDVAREHALDDVRRSSCLSLAGSC